LLTVPSDPIRATNRDNSPELGSCRLKCIHCLFSITGGYVSSSLLKPVIQAMEGRELCCSCG
jgi:hypothetical protein